MLLRLALLVLGPLLFLQGKYVRRVTPRLPEAEGAREGCLGSGPPLSLLILGDSAAAGVGVADQSQALSGQLTEALAEQYAVTWRLRANSGDRLDQLLDTLRNSPDAEAPVDWVLISIGVNDVTALRRTRTWITDLQALIELLRSRFKGPQILFSSLPPMGQFPALPQPLRWWMGLRARAFDQAMQALLAPEPDCHYLRIPYGEDLSGIASDGFHPGAGAYRIWAQAAAAQMLEIGSAQGGSGNEGYSRKVHDSTKLRLEGAT